LAPTTLCLALPSSLEQTQTDLGSCFLSTLFVIILAFAAPLSAQEIAPGVFARGAIALMSEEN